MIESMLEPHLKSMAGADQMQVGITFLILGGVYMLTTPFVGYVSSNPSVAEVLLWSIIVASFVVVVLDKRQMLLEKNKYKQKEAGLATSTGLFHPGLGDPSLRRPWVRKIV